LFVFLLSVIIGGYALFSSNRISNYIAQMEELTVANNHAVAMVQAHHVWLYRITESFLFGIPFPGGLDPTTCIWGRWRYSPDGYIYQFDDAELMRLIRAVDHPHARLHLDGAEALRLREAGQHEAALALLHDVVIPYGNQSTAAITALSDRYYELWREVREDVALVASQVFTTILVIFILGLVAFVILSILIPQNIMKPVKQLRSVASDVAKGNMNVNIDRTNVPNDEMGELTHDICALVDVIRSVVDDLTEFERVYNIDGDIEYRMDESKYHNSFRDMVAGSNRLLDSTASDILGLLSALNEVNEGNFSPEIRKLPGKKVVMEEAIKSTTANMQAINNEIKAMIDAVAAKGDLSFQINDSKYKGDWRVLMAQLNNITQSVNKPLEIIGVAMDEMKVGNFDIAAITAKMSQKGIDVNMDNYKGVFNRILTDFSEAIHSVSSYIEEIANSLRGISGGDLTVSIRREYLGSFEAIKNSLNNISSTLNKTMSDISSASEHVLSGASQIAVSAQDLATGAQMQASSVDELNATIDMVAQQTKQNAKNATSASELSMGSAESAQKGNTSMQEMLAAMEQIKDSSSDISKVIKVIEDIAFQTNLLALNASVEAARAGEHGKGFAVVADEVRTLAGRSSTSASETNELIATSISRVESGSEIAGNTAGTLDAIVANVSEVSTIISNIAAASNEQAESISQISEGLSQISKVTQSNSAVSQETAAASEELNSQAEMLQKLVAYFKL